MTVTVCTGWSAAGRIEYGDNFLESFGRHWPAGGGLAVYVEDTEGYPAVWEGAIHSLWDCDGAREFIDEFRGQPVANGRKDAAGMLWKDSELRRGYSFRYDAWKFSRQCMIPLQASKALPDGDILVWLDGDVVTFKDVPVGFVEGLLGAADGCYLGRGRKHSEIGFWAVRLGPQTRMFLKRLAFIYTSREVFQLGEWHSAYVWDHARREAEAARPPPVFKDLSPGGTDHVWFQTPLGQYMDHLKGNRKQLGRSPERRT